MRVGDDAREAIGRTLRRDNERVGAVGHRLAGGGKRGGIGRIRHRTGAFARQRLVAGQRAERLVEPEEERRAQDEAGRDVLAIRRKQPRQPHLARVAAGVSVEASGIGIEQSAYVGWLLQIIAVRRFPRAEQRQRIIDLSAIRSGHRAESPARHRDGFL